METAPRSLWLEIYQGGVDEGYDKGFKAGIEAAAKACDIAVQQADDHLAERGHSVIAAATRMEAKHLAGVIRALSPSPSATEQTQD